MEYRRILTLLLIWLTIPSASAIITPKAILPLGEYAESAYIDASLMTPETAYRRSGNVGSGFRFYDPSLQRWINQDPIGEAGGINLYGFVGNDPVNRIDPQGLSWWDGFGRGLIGVGVGVGVGASAVGGYMVGNNAYEFVSREEAFTGRPLTQDEWETKGGQLAVDAATLGLAKRSWYNRGAGDDWAWLKLSPKRRWAAEKDKIAIGDDTWQRVGGLSPGERNLGIVSDWSPSKLPNIWRTGASPGLRLVWPFVPPGKHLTLPED